MNFTINVPLFLDFSGGEFLLIGVVFLMFFGSKSIPGIARTLGKIMRQFRDAAGDVQREIQESANLNMKDFDLKTPSNTDTKQYASPTLPPIVTPSSSMPPKDDKPQADENKTTS
jgi:sec-independent protein translocase protein TatA